MAEDWGGTPTILDQVFFLAEGKSLGICGVSSQQPGQQPGEGDFTGALIVSTTFVIWYRLILCRPQNSCAVRWETHMTTVRQLRVKLHAGKAKALPGPLTRARKDSVSACRLWIWQEVLCTSTLRAAASFSSWVWALRATSVCCCGEAGVSRGNQGLNPSFRLTFSSHHSAASNSEETAI